MTGSQVARLGDAVGSTAIVEDPEGEPAVEASLTNRAVSGTLWSSMSTVARQLLSLVSVAVLARRLGPEAYGVMAMAAAVTAFLVNFRDLGTAAAIIQRPVVSDRLLSTLFWVNCLLGVTLTAVVFLGAPAAGAFFKDLRVVPILQALSVSFLLTSVGVVHNALLARRMAFRDIATTDVVSAIAAYGIAIGCALTGLGVWSLVAGQLVGTATSTALYWVFARWRPSRHLDIDALRSVQGFSLNLSGFGLLNYFSRNADYLVVGRWLGDLALGYYQMAYNLMLYPLQNISSVVGQVLLPAFSKISNDDERFRSAYTRGCGLIGLVAFPVVAGLGVVADPFVRAVLGSDWVSSIVVFQILAPVGLVQSVSSTVGHIYIAKGRTDLMFRWGIYSSIVLVGAFLVGLPWGIRGVATAYSVAYLVFIMIPGFLVPFRLIGLRLSDFARHLAPQLAITGGMVIACAGLLWLFAAWGVTNDWIRLVSVSALGAVLYVLAFLIARPPVIMDAEDVLTGSYPVAARRFGSVLRLFAR